ncbi:MAG: polyphosphate kinase [Ignavibacteria bacterium]|nr:MAG: polyphosphate kinase [Ignavibacteria bacterium]KAF0160402.1 MAG: polyphosphate kinase [Ignavibacteria bacterium]
MRLSKENLNKYVRPDNFFNRDLSWLEFNRRVLEEALNPQLPLLEQIKFISIFFSNLDEFYMIRIAGIKEQIRAKVIDTSIDGLSPIEQLKLIEANVQKMLKEIYDYWHHKIIPSLRENKILICELNQLNKEEREAVNDYFVQEIYPVLTPLAFDPGRPFPYISNLSLSFAARIKKPNGEKNFARIKVPTNLPRLLRVEQIIKTKQKSSNGTIKFILIGDVIKANMHYLFPGIEILEAYKFRITRDTDLEIQEDEADDLLQVIEENIKQRKFGSVVRLEVEKRMPEYMIETLIENLEITHDDVHVIDGVLGLSDVMILYDLQLPHLKEKPFHAVTPEPFEEENIFTLIQKKDILLYHPYDSFNPVVEFVKQASRDPEVLAIKQTLYRVGLNSPIVKYLIEAAERKKQVAVLVELKARFDEENNIYWARELEKAGVHVVYGLVGLKTHAKMSLVVRKEIDGVKRYVHLGTGNYNTTTARIYTDIGFFTSDPEICADVSEIFNYLTGYSEQKQFRKLAVAPINMREKFIELIEREIKNVKNGGQGYLVFKLNSLVDPLLIAAMYEASRCGVKIDLIVRGISCLIPMQPGLSDNIRVISIVGRFLEHSRIYYAYNNGKDELYCSSADIMQRNLDRRVEITFPINDPDLKNFIKDSVLRSILDDTIKSRILLPTGKYAFYRPVYNENSLSHQDWMMQRAISVSKKIVKREVSKF